MLATLTLTANKCSQLSNAALINICMYLILTVHIYTNTYMHSPSPLPADFIILMRHLANIFVSWLALSQLGADLTWLQHTGLFALCGLGNWHYLICLYIYQLCYVLLYLDWRVFCAQLKVT